MRLQTMGKWAVANGLGGFRGTISHTGLPCLHNIPIRDDA